MWYLELGQLVTNAAAKSGSGGRGGVVLPDKLSLQQHPEASVCAQAELPHSLCHSFDI